MKALYGLLKSVAVVSLYTFGALTASAAILPVSGNVIADNFTAKVVSVDVANHVVVLAGEDGNNVSVQVPEEARDLANLKAGDVVDTTVTHSVAVAFDTKVDTSAPTASSTQGEMNATKNDPQPGGEAFRQVNVQLKIKHIDLKKNEITFVGPKGQEKTITVENPKIQAKLKDLKVNQSVRVTYTDSIKITAHPAKS